MSKVKILVLDRSWVLVGEVWESGCEIMLKNGSVVRYWGTEKGLGELANLGPREKTKLDPFNHDVKINKAHIFFSIDCNDEKWLCSK